MSIFVGTPDSLFQWFALIYYVFINIHEYANEIFSYRMIRCKYLSNCYSNYIYIKNMQPLWFDEKWV